MSKIIHRHLVLIGTGYGCEKLGLGERKGKREVFELKFDNPVGLAAGFDKDAKLFDELVSFGFGFIEILISIILTHTTNRYISEMVRKTIKRNSHTVDC